MIARITICTIFVGALFVGAGCTSQSPGAIGSSAAAGGTLGSGASGGSSTGSGSTASAAPCIAPAYCSAYNVRATCVVAPDGSESWVEETCPYGCYAGKCSDEACADECALGETGSRGQCRLWDMPSQTFVDADPVGSMHDRARGYTAFLRRELMPDGGVVEGLYADQSHTELVEVTGTVDSALWTGTALAAEAWRLGETGSSDAARRVRAIAETLHLWFNISGVPGYLARYAAPLPPTVPFHYTCTLKSHCDGMVDGMPYFWRGDTSRDQYTGVMLGYLLAYLTTPDADVRAAIVDDVVELVVELMQQRQDLPVHLVIDDLEMDATIDAENVIPVTQEMEDGRIQIAIDTSNPEDAVLDGVREFLPDASVALKQLPLLSWLPAIPRPGSSLMLGLFFRMALTMTENVEAHARTRQQIDAYYQAHADAWMGISEQWSYDNECSSKYYSTHISINMAHAYALLETDPALRSRLEVVLAKMRARLGDHKNPYYAFLWGSVLASQDASEMAAAGQQLGQFEPAPRVFIARDSSGIYPHDPDCSSPGNPRSTVAVDVGHRVLDGFLWQRHPFHLVSAGDPLQIFPGVDYLAAYWIGRRHGLLGDDRPGSCARWDDG